MSEPFTLKEPDRDWSNVFQRERNRLLPHFTVPPVLFEHMGSTAVPGLVAKPIIDMIVLVGDLAQIRPDIPAFEALGYIHRADYANQDKLFLMRRHAGTRERTHHLHIHDDAEEVHRHLLFRDHLRAHREAREAYRDLKLRLAQRFAHDRMSYSRHKTAFIDAIVASVGGPDRRMRWDP